MVSRSMLWPLTLAGLVGLTLSQPARAEYVRKNYIQNGGSACTGASIRSEVMLLKRPLALVNAGPSTAQVTCSAVTNYMNPNIPLSVIAYFTNRSAQTVTIACTLWNGAAWGAIAVPKTISAPPGVLVSMGWNQAEMSHEAANISCALPPMVELDAFGQLIDEEISTPS